MSRIFCKVMKQEGLNPSEREIHLGIQSILIVINLESKEQKNECIVII